MTQAGARFDRGALDGGVVIDVSPMKGARVAALRRARDPENFFRMNKNLKP